MTQWIAWKIKSDQAQGSTLVPNDFPRLLHYTHHDHPIMQISISAGAFLLLSLSTISGNAVAVHKANSRAAFDDYCGEFTNWSTGTNECVCL